MDLGNGWGRRCCGWLGARKVQEDVDYCALIAEVTEATNTNVSQLAHALGNQERITDWLPMRLRQRWQRGQAIHLARVLWNLAFSVENRSLLLVDRRMVAGNGVCTDAMA